MSLSGFDVYFVQFEAIGLKLFMFRRSFSNCFDIVQFFKCHAKAFFIVCIKCCILTGLKFWVKF